MLEQSHGVVVGAHHTVLGAHGRHCSSAVEYEKVDPRRQGYLVIAVGPAQYLMLHRFCCCLQRRERLCGTGETGDFVKKLLVQEGYSLHKGYDAESP
jgi:hypothetical protein